MTRLKRRSLIAPTDDYQRFLALRRYQNALLHPWIVLAALGLVLVVFSVHAILTSPASPLRTPEMPISYQYAPPVAKSAFEHPFVGGFVVATVVAFYGLAVQSTKRWPPAVMLLALLVSLWNLLDQWLVRNRALMASSRDGLFLGAFVAMLILTIHLLLRKPPRRPTPTADRTAPADVTK